MDGRVLPLTKFLNPLVRLIAAAGFLTIALPLAAQQVPLEIEGLPNEAPRVGTVITVDLATNQAYLFEDGQLIRKSKAATGSDKILRQGRKVWWFRTPRGRHQVVRKITDPVWTKPDWAFVEEGKAIPPLGDPSRQQRGKLGKYALDLGEGILLHGTDDPKSIGRKASHGCIRLPNDMLAAVYQRAAVGTEVYLFESRLSDDSMASKGRNDLEMVME
ncbi:MAG: hypothetical protein QOH21_3598 [Acidobacteriota bacterium]|jgi:hypothetical protein|nr:hypothetical protein [Acidobacteriota bacterium]